MSRFLSNELSKLTAYVPGEQPQDKKYVKLNTNESPFPPSNGVINAIGNKEIERLRLYCDPQSKLLKSELARVYNAEIENVFVSNGSDDILNFAFMAYGHLGVAFADITYGFYSVFASLYGLDAQIVPLNSDFTLNVNGFLGLNKLIVIANPNAPTGLVISTSDVEKILLSNPNGVVVVDEAYVDFGGTSVSELTKKYNNLLCVQTFSKSRSMAGARLGFAIANAEIISDLEKIKYSTNPYNVNALTQIAGVSALKDNNYYKENALKIIENRNYTVTELKKLGFTVLDSKANFVFAKSDKISGEELYKKLKENGVLVRHFTSERIKEFNRITIGSIEEMQIFIEKVKLILGE
ncbi:MAG: histidinol-phosphate transaminase [Clostridia bacterium]|nr:histidinol-phosphate transaminase [Clostridia bacterium]